MENKAMYKNCREEMFVVMRAFVIETGENEFSRLVLLQCEEVEVSILLER
jgi:hypothetical protein